MNLQEAKQLKSGDTVSWINPDDFLEVISIVINHIEFVDDETVLINYDTFYDDDATESVNIKDLRKRTVLSENNPFRLVCAYSASADLLKLPNAFIETELVRAASEYLPKIKLLSVLGQELNDLEKLGVHILSTLNQYYGSE